MPVQNITKFPEYEEFIFNKLQKINDYDDVLKIEIVENDLAIVLCKILLVL
jgi:hypothetical protein